MAFGIQETMVGLAANLRRFRLDLAPGARLRPVQRPTLRPAGGLPMTLALRPAA